MTVAHGSVWFIAAAAALPFLRDLGNNRVIWHGLREALSHAILHRWYNIAGKRYSLIAQIVFATKVSVQLNEFVQLDSIGAFFRGRA